MTFKDDNFERPQRKQSLNNPSRQCVGRSNDPSAQHNLQCYRPTPLNRLNAYQSGIKHEQADLIGSTKRSVTSAQAGCSANKTISFSRAKVQQANLVRSPENTSCETRRPLTATRTASTAAYYGSSGKEGLLRHDCRHVHAQSIAACRDRESLAEELHQLLIAVDPSHPKYVRTPIAKDLDSLTLAYAVLLVKEGIFDSSQMQVHSCSCLVSKAVNAVQLQNLLSSISSMRKSGKRRPISAAFVHHLPQASRIHLLRRVYEQPHERPKPTPPSPHSHLFESHGLDKYLSYLMRDKSFQMDGFDWLPPYKGLPKQCSPVDCESEGVRVDYESERVKCESERVRVECESEGQPSQVILSHLPAENQGDTLLHKESISRGSAPLDGRECSSSSSSSSSPSIRITNEFRQQVHSLESLVPENGAIAGLSEALIEMPSIEGLEADPSGLSTHNGTQEELSISTILNITGGATVSTGENDDALKVKGREGLPPNSSTIVNSPIAITRTPDLPSRLPDACVGVPIQKEHFEHVPSLPIENELSFGLALQLPSDAMQLPSDAVDLKHSLAKDGPCQENDHEAVEAVELTTKAVEVQSNHDLALSMIMSSEDFTATSGREEEAETSDDVVVDSGREEEAETKEVVAVKSTTESTTEEVKAEQSSLEVAYVEVLPEDDATVTSEDADANRTLFVTDDLPEASEDVAEASEDVAETSEDVAEAMEDLVTVPSASGDEGTLFMRPPLEEVHTVMSPEDEAEAASSSEVRGTVTSVSATQPLSDLQTDGSESLKDDSPSDTNQQLPAAPQKETSTSSLDKILCADNQLSHDEIVSKNASSLDNLLVPVNLPPSLKLHEIYISFQERLQEALLTTMAQVNDLEKGIISEDSMVLPQIPEQQGLLCDSPAGIQWQAAVVEYAKYLGMDPEKDKDLMFIAHRAIEAEVPAGWTVHLDEQGFEFFAHLESRISQYEHPMDTFYRNLYNDTKERRRG